MNDTVINLDVVDGVRVVGIADDVDISNAATLQRYLDEASGDATTLVLSLERCRSIDSNGLRPILRLAARIGRRFYVVVPPGSGVRRTFDILGLHARLNVCDTLDNALAQANEKRIPA